MTKIGFNGINPVQLVLNKDGRVYEVEGYFGSEIPKEYASVLEEALDIQNVNKDNNREYHQLVRKFGRNFVEGDIYRLFTNCLDDSHIASQP